MAPSQPLAAVAGVQLASRQHRPAPLVQASPVELRQLSTVWAPAADARIAAANIVATLFKFFMDSSCSEKRLSAAVKRRLK
jgi:hypothetical protein